MKMNDGPRSNTFIISRWPGTRMSDPLFSTTPVRVTMTCAAKLNRCSPTKRKQKNHRTTRAGARGKDDGDEHSATSIGQTINQYKIISASARAEWARFISLKTRG